MGLTRSATRAWWLLASVAAVCISLTAATAATSQASDTASRELSVVTTTNIVAASIEPVVPEQVAVTSLMGAGVDPHSYQPVASDLSKLREADLVLAVGLDLEANLLDVLDQLPDTEVVRIGETIPRELLRPVDDDEMYDPHVWFDIAAWSNAIMSAADAVTDLAPHMDAHVTAQTDAFLADLQDLQGELDEIYGTIPSAQRVLITSHDAFGYLGRAHGLEVLGIQGISTAAEATTDDVQAAADLVVQREIPAIFIESSVNPATVDGVRSAAARAGVDVDLGDALYSDAAGAHGTPSGTYAGMLRANAHIIADAFGGR